MQIEFNPRAIRMRCYVFSPIAFEYKSQSTQPPI